MVFMEVLPGKPARDNYTKKAPWQEPLISQE